MSRKGRQYPRLGVREGLKARAVETDFVHITPAIAAAQLLLVTVQLW